MAESDLYPDQQADLNVRRRQLAFRHGLGQGQQDYLFQTAHREYGRQLGDLITAYTRSREKLPFRAAARGVLNSGIYGRQVANTTQDYMKALTDVNSRVSDQLQGFLLAKQQLQVLNTAGMADIDELSAAAQAIRAANGS